MLNHKLIEEEKIVRKLLDRNPFIRKMWRERQRVFELASKKETVIEKKYGRLAKKAGLKSLKFAYNDGYCFGIDVNDVDLHGSNPKEHRLLIHDTALNAK